MLKPSPSEIDRQELLTRLEFESRKCKSLAEKEQFQTLLTRVNSLKRESLSRDDELFLHELNAEYPVFKVFSLTIEYGRVSLDVLRRAMKCAPNVGCLIINGNPSFRIVPELSEITEPLIKQYRGIERVILNELLLVDFIQKLSPKNIEIKKLSIWEHRYSVSRLFGPMAAFEGVSLSEYISGLDGIMSLVLRNPRIKVLLRLLIVFNLLSSGFPSFFLVSGWGNSSSRSLKID
jgi:hypothetical protein